MRAASGIIGLFKFHFVTSLILRSYIELCSSLRMTLKRSIDFEETTKGTSNSFIKRTVGYGTCVLVWVFEVNY